MATKKSIKKSTSKTKSPKKPGKIITIKEPPVISGEWQGQKASWRADRIVVRLAVNDNKSDKNNLEAIPKGNEPKRIVQKIDKAAKRSLLSSLKKKLPKIKVLSSSDTSYKVFIEVPEKSKPEDFVKELQSLPEIQFASLDFLMHTSLAPIDPVYTGMFNFRKNGEILFTDFGHWTYKRVNFEQAWNFSPGDGVSILVGIVDSGISMTTNDPATGVLDHPDLLDAGKYQLGTNFKEPGTLPRDDNSHGTHVAGTIGSTTNNGTFTSATNWDAQLYIVRALGGPRGSGSSVDIAEGVREITNAAIAQNKKGIINLSLGGPGFLINDPIIMEDFEYALLNGMLIVAATGNDSENNAIPPVVVGGQFPANLAITNATVLAVGSTDHNDLLSNFSNTGPEVSVVAPGEFVISTNPTYACENINTVGGIEQTVNTSINTGVKSGTSMATPHVAGLASLLWGYYPDLTAREVARAIKLTATDMGVQDANERNDQFGHGLINAFRALDEGFREIIVLSSEIRFEDVQPGNSQTIEFNFQYISYHATTIEIYMQTANANTLLRLENSQVSGNQQYISMNMPEAGLYIPIDLSVQLTFSPENFDDFEEATLYIATFEGGFERIPISVTGSATSTPENFAYAMVLDKSGSMNSPSGVVGLSRLDVLKRATSNMVDILNPNTGLGIVSFSADAATALPFASPITPGGADPIRINAHQVIENLSASGSTSIGDGLIEANNMLLNEAFTRKNIILFSDGKENSETLISSALPQLDPTTKIFAIGMGTEANIDIEKLSAVTNTFGGALYLTGPDAENFDQWVSKIFLTALAEASGEVIVLDPSGKLREGHTKQIPFVISDEETMFDAMLIMPYKEAFLFNIIDPSGKKYSSNAATIDGIEGYNGNFISYFRITLPKGNNKRIGRWRAEFTLTTKSSQKRNNISLSKGGVPYTFIVKAKSNLKMELDVPQYLDNKKETYKLNNKLISNGSHATQSYDIKTELISGKSQISYVASRKPEGNRDIQHIFETPNSGIYQIRQIISGKTKAGNPFTREVLRSICVKNEFLAQNAKLQKKKKKK